MEKKKLERCSTNKTVGRNGSHLIELMSISCVNKYTFVILIPHRFGAESGGKCAIDFAFQRRVSASSSVKSRVSERSKATAGRCLRARRCSAKSVSTLCTQFSRVEPIARAEAVVTHGRFIIKGKPRCSSGARSKYSNDRARERR